MACASILADLFPNFFQHQYGVPVNKQISKSEVAMIIFIIEAISIAVLTVVTVILKIVYYIISTLLSLLFFPIQVLYYGLILGVAAFIFFMILALINKHLKEEEVQEIKEESADCQKGTTRTKVVLPSGLNASLPVPAEYCNCNKYSVTKLAHLHKGCSDFQTIVGEMNKTIKKHVSGSFSAYHIVSIQRVQNCCLWKKFRNRQTDISKEGCRINQRMLFHGTATADDIIKRGFDERHSNPNGMFGAGVYFAEHSSKSNQYVYGYMGGNGCKTHQDKNCFACERKMLLCRVSLGKIHQLTSANKMAHPPPGYHSVAGVPTPPGEMTLFGLLLGGVLQYPEYVIYRGEQAYPEYLITYKIMK